MASVGEVYLVYKRGQRDLWGTEYSCEDYKKDVEDSAGSTGRGAG